MSQFHCSIRRALSLVVAVLFLTAAPSGELRASTVQASTDCSTDPSTHNFGSSSTPGVAAVSSVPGCYSSATADYGILKVGGTNQATNGSAANAAANYEIDFFLTNASLGPNTHITLNIPIPYHFTLAAGGSSSTASFAFAHQAPFYYINYSSSSNPFGGNNCPSPAASVPSCNGTYEGTVNATFDAAINSTGPNRFALQASILAGNGTADATNTITLGTVILPNGVNFSYDVGGNPMNFAYVSAVPESSTILFALGGLAGCAVLRGRKKLYSRSVF